MDKFIVFAENIKRTDFFFLSEFEDGIIVLSRALVHSKMFNNVKETEDAIKAFSKSKEIDASSIAVKPINRDTERGILNSRKRREEKKTTQKEYKTIYRKILLGKNRHTWIKCHDGQKYFFKCPKCKCTRMSTTEGVIYIINDEQHVRFAPDCIK